MVDNVIQNLSDAINNGAKIFTDYSELNKIYYKIAKKIAEYRKTNKLSQTQLAKKLGVGQSMVSKLESGEYNPTIEQLWKISKKLGLNFNIIFDVPRNDVSIEKILISSAQCSYTLYTPTLIPTLIALKDTAVASATVGW